MSEYNPWEERQLEANDVPGDPEPDERDYECSDGDYEYIDELDELTARASKIKAALLAIFGIL